MSVFEKHFSRVEFTNKQGGFTALELGPGDSLASAVIARAFGAKACYLVDSANFASKEVHIYRDVVALLERKGFKPERIPEGADCDAILGQSGGVYLTQGLASLHRLADASVDYIWSQAVLEHIRLKEFDATLVELRRILRPGGACSHRIDLQDHLSGSLNNLRFSETVWEADWMAMSGFYTNRIRYAGMLERFERAGFSCQVIHVDRWNKLPLSKARMTESFSALSDNELLINGFDVVLTPRAA